ncbi:MAG: RraA family protein, partial [Verrucomicrobiota bacterium]
MNTHWKSDEELFALSRSELYTAVVGDIMDILGYKRQFLPPSIQPLRDDMVVIGRAMPVLEMDDEG